MTSSPTLGSLFAALSAAQAEIKAALKDSTGQVGQQKTRYADLASVWDACRESLGKHKLAVAQMPSADGNKVTVTTVIGCAAGEWIAESLTMLAANASPQAIGSCITYARRYGLSAMVGVAPDDDDGAAAQPAPQAQPGRGPPAATGGHGAPKTPPPAAAKPVSVPDGVRRKDADLAGDGVISPGELVAAVEARLRQPLDRVTDAESCRVVCKELVRAKKLPLLNEIDRLAGEKGVSWALVLRYLRLPDETQLDALAYVQAVAATAYLAAMPDADAMGDDEIPY